MSQIRQEIDRYESLSRIARGMALQIDPANVQLKTFENQLAKLRKDVASRTGRQQAMPAATSAPAAVAAAPASSGPVGGTPAAQPAASAKLPGGVDKRLRDARALLARGMIDDAAAVFAEIGAAYGGQFDTNHPDYKDVSEKLAQARASVTAAADNQRAAQDADRQRQQAMEEQSAQWVARLRVFAPHGAPVFGHATQSVPELLIQIKAHDEALDTWRSYQAEAFPNGKTEELQQIDRNVSPAFEQFPTYLQQVRAWHGRQISSYLQSRLDELAKTIEGKPAIMGEADLAEIEQRLEDVRPALEQEGDRWAAIQQMADDIKAKNAANRAARARLTVIRTEAYKGPDAQQLRDYAEGLVRRHSAQAQIVKTVIYSEDWKESTQWEDASGTNRLVTRREIYAQSAARIDGTGRLFTIYLTQELRADRTWSNVSGNIMHTDDIAEANLTQ